MARDALRSVKDTAHRPDRNRLVWAWRSAASESWRCSGSFRMFFGRKSWENRRSWCRIWGIGRHRSKNRHRHCSNNRNNYGKIRKLRPVCVGFSVVVWRSVERSFVRLEFAVVLRNPSPESHHQTITKGSDYASICCVPPRWRKNSPHGGNLRQ